MTDIRDHHDDFRHRIREALTLFERRWRAALIPFCIVTTAALWGSHYLPRLYRATTTFERRDDPVLSNLIQAQSPYSFDKLRRSLQTDMTGTRAMSEVAVRLGLAAPVPEHEAASDELRQKLAAKALSQVKRSGVRIVQSSDSLDMVQVEVVAESPARAEAFAVAMRDAYVDYARGRINEILLRTKEFFEQELETRVDEVTCAYDQMGALLADFPGIDPKRPSSVGERLEALRDRRDELTRQVTELTEEVNVREEFVSTAPSDLSIVPDWLAEDLARRSGPYEGDPEIRAEIHQLERQKADLQTLRGMTDEHPSIVAIDRKTARLYAQLHDSILNDAQAPGTMPAEPGQLTEAMRIWLEQKSRVELELRTRRQKLALAQETLVALEEKLARFEALYDQLVAEHGDFETRAAELKRAEADAQTWSGYLTQLNRILTAESQQRGVTFSTLEEPRHVDRAISPTMRSVASVSTALGLVAAAICILLIEVFDRSFKSATQVARALGVAVLEGIGEIVTPTVRREHMLRRAFWAPLVAMLLFVVIGTFALTYLKMERPELYARVSDRAAETFGTTGMMFNDLFGE